MKAKYSGEFLLPCPVVLVTSKQGQIENVFTVAWAGVASSHPEYITIAINPKRFSHSIIEKSKQFCINVPNVELLEKVDMCGIYSGREVDKFEMCGFTRRYYNDYILLEECPFHILCEVESIVRLGSHDLFVSRVIEKYSDTAQTLYPIIYYRPHYHRLEKESLGFYGFTK